MVKLITYSYSQQILELWGVKYSNLTKIMREVVLIAGKKYRVYEVD
ncbi:MAG: hypothetical protein HC819_12745 [Cyclobacteriaceae bacterium]|nr:hypothetical protein [Cyclobacteriaceae bacterium]